MTLAERLIKKGWEEGYNEVMANTALKMFKRGIGLDLVCECIELPFDQLQALQKQAGYV